MAEARWFPNGCVASPHYLASGVGLAVLADGGNALDAAVATNLALGAVAPYNCGFGGDLFAIIWDGGALHAYNGSGRAPAAATVDEVRARAESETMPPFGPLTVTVPGAVEAWFTLLDRFGTRSFADLAAPALRFARDGFTPSRAIATVIARRRDVYDPAHGWHAVYGAVEPDRRFRQPWLARTIESLMTKGPTPYYQGEIAAAITAHVRQCGGLLVADDLAGHHGDWVSPVAAPYRDVFVHEMPPNSQGITALIALGILDELPVESPGARREHVHVEAMKRALVDRDAHLTDPEHMTVDVQSLLEPERLARAAATIDPDRAADLAAGRAATGGTIYLCAADANGMIVSLIQSNYAGFGSGVTVPEWGINLQNRGAYFALDPAHVNVIAPGKRTLHTLMPAFAFRRGRPWLAFGAMGADGQAQTQLQILTKLVDDGADLEDAIDAPRWFVSPADHSVTVESRIDTDVVEGWRDRGHTVNVTGRYDSLMGHAHGILVDPEGNGYRAAYDPRSEGAALGH